MRYFLLVLTACAGCGATSNSPPPEKQVVVPAYVDSRPILAHSIASHYHHKDEQTVRVGQVCPVCKGSGKNKTDGTMTITCEACQGDGKVDEGDPILTE